MIHNRRVVALIPIKDHSERVTGKNFREFAGKPLYNHIVATLDKTYAVDEIVIDTDSPRVIMEACKLSPKLHVIERPKELHGDEVSTNKIFEYDMTQCEADIFIQTHSTNPLLKSETIALALKTFVEKEGQMSDDGTEYDSLFGVNEHHSRFYRKDGSTINHDPENLIPTQEVKSGFSCKSRLV